MRVTSRMTPRVVVATGIVGVVAMRLVLAQTRLGADEAGFLMVGAGWHHGSSLYGDFWVDRPPLLIWIMRVAGDLQTLRVLGCAAAILTVLGAAYAAWLARGSRAAGWAAGTASVLVSAQWLGVARINGEMLAAPFVAWSIALTLYAFRRAPARHVPAALGAGALAAAAILVKQSVVEPFVFVLVLSLGLALRRPELRGTVARVLAAGVVGAVVTAGLVLLDASSRGTAPAELFDAVVTFRVEAGEVIRSSASGATPRRLLILLGTWAASGLGAVTVLTLWHAARRRDPVLVATATTLVVSLLVALFGGSYWAHYLIQLIPAASLGAGLLVSLMPRPVLRRIAVVTVALTMANTVWAVGFKVDDNARQHVVGTWLRQAGHASDSAVVAYGQANVLMRAGMSSPYEYLWALPIRTRDGDLHDLAAVLASPDRPTWVVDWSGLRTWGITPDKAELVLHEDYRHVATVCGTPVWLVRADPRALPDLPRECP